MPSFERTATREASVAPTGVNDSKDEELGKFCEDIRCTDCNCCMYVVCCDD